jgi:Zn-dependent protease
LEFCAAGGVAAGTAAVEGGPIDYALTLLVALSIAVLLHEVGHAAAAANYRLPSKRIVLTGFGGFVEFARPPTTRTEENVIAFAGPLANLATAAALYALARFGLWWPPADTLLTVSLAMGVFNLLPAFPLDGGTIARNLIGLKFSDSLAQRITVWAGIVIGVYLVLMGFAAHQYWATFGGFYIAATAMERRRRMLGYGRSR